MGMHIALVGYGKMGKAVEKIAMEKGHTIAMVFDEKHVLSDPGQLAGADVAIEFSQAVAMPGHIKSCFKAGIPVVSGTTGLDTKTFRDLRKMCRDHRGSMVYATNFSVGMHLMFRLTARLARWMEAYPEYEAKIEETHHTTKIDSPSGTAITLAEHILAQSSRLREWMLAPDEAEGVLPVIAHRIADVRGVHHVLYTGPEDRISIRHEALSRDAFARGALLAAMWIRNRKGFFDFEDVLDLQ